MSCDVFPALGRGQGIEIRESGGIPSRTCAAARVTHLASRCHGERRRLLSHNAGPLFADNWPQERTIAGLPPVPPAGSVLTGCHAAVSCRFVRPGSSLRASRGPSRAARGGGGSPPAGAACGPPRSAPSAWRDSAGRLPPGAGFLGDALTLSPCGDLSTAVMAVVPITSHFGGAAFFSTAARGDAGSFPLPLWPLLPGSAARLSVSAFARGDAGGFPLPL